MDHKLPAVAILSILASAAAVRAKDASEIPSRARTLTETPFQYSSCRAPTSWETGWARARGWKTTE
jgi:hypothetical protein